MRILALALLTLTTLAGCATAVDDSALASVLSRPMTDHAATLAGDDIPAMRRSGRALIATYDAAVPQ